MTKVPYRRIVKSERETKATKRELKLFEIGDRVAKIRKLLENVALKAASLTWEQPFEAKFMDFVKEMDAASERILDAKQTLMENVLDKEASSDYEDGESEASDNDC